MTNRFFGEVSVPVDDKIYTLRCDFNVMCILETEFGQSFDDLVASIEAGSLSFVELRRIVQKFLRKHHPDATEEEAGDVISRNTLILQELLEAASPAPEDGEPGNAPKAKPAKSRPPARR